MRKSTQKLPPEEALYEWFDRALDVRPFLILEVGYNRVADWGVHIYDSTGRMISDSIKIISVQNPERKDAFKEAVKQLKEHFKID